jgi:tRNA threonylcarbamoyladenosine biosynthesis protein TsaE
LTTLDKPVRAETESAEATVALGRSVGELLRPGAVVGLFGELGSGKTTFIKGCALGLGVADARVVTSPTFTLMNIYRGRCAVYHFDLYRIRTPAEFAELGHEEFLGGEGVCLIEWAERAGPLLPADALRVVCTTVGPERRRIEIARAANGGSMGAPSRKEGR